MDVYENLKKLGIYQMPAIPAPGGLFLSCKVSGKLAFVSGQGPMTDGKPYMTGEIGSNITLVEAKRAARITATNILAVLHSAVGDLNKVKGVIKVTGYIVASSYFNKEHDVMDAASQLFIDAFGDEGRHTRTVISVSELPSRMPIEIETIFELH